MGDSYFFYIVKQYRRCLYIFFLPTIATHRATIKQSQQNSCTYSKFITTTLFKTCKGVLIRLFYAHYRAHICVTCPFPCPVNRTYLVLLVTKTCLPSFTFVSLNPND